MKKLIFFVLLMVFVTGCTSTEYTVIFQEPDGTVLKTETVSEGSLATAPENVEKEGYTFLGWDQEFDKITKDLVIIAIYEIKTYSVVFMDRDEVLKEEIVEYGQSATAPDTPIKEGLEFKGWDQSYDEVTSDIVVRTIYDIQIITITFDSAGGNNFEPKHVEYGETVQLPLPEKDGYDFIGWYYLGEIVESGVVFDNMDLLAVWVEEGTFILSFDTRGGQSISDQYVMVDTIVNLPTPTRRNFVFSHWILNDVIVDNNFEYDYYDNVELQAVWLEIYSSSGNDIFYRNTQRRVLVPDTYSRNEEEFRGVWVSNLVGDISSYASRTQMEAQLTTVLDNMVAWNMNAILFHLRIMNDALYDTDLSPKSNYISALDFEEWDYLEWFIEEAHKRDIEFHAWLNPYRIGSSRQTIDDIIDRYANYPNNPARKAENILIGDGGAAILNPGEPEVRDFVVDVVVDIIDKYNVDAIHFDDYFYISGLGLDGGADATTYEKYKHLSNTTTIQDWRREQVDLFIEDLSNTMRAYNLEHDRNVQLGVSPTAIWRNGNGQVTYDQNGTAITNGSNTFGFSHYDIYLFADSKKWVDEEWIDYIVPQAYAGFTHETEPYADVIDWWARVVRHKNVKLYSGSGVFHASRASSTHSWTTNPYEMSDQLLFDSRLPEVQGTVLFRYGIFRNLINQGNPGVLRVLNEFWIEKVPTPR